MGPATHPTVILETSDGCIPLRYTIERIPEQPDAQVAATIARMCQYVNEDCTSPLIQRDAREALALDPSNPFEAVHSFVRSRMKFKNDEAITAPYTWMLERPGAGANDDYFVEMLKRPVDVSEEYRLTGEKVEGDCDDFSMYCSAILRALSGAIRCCFSTVGANEKDPKVFSHVYVSAYINGQRVPMDCSHGQYAGWETLNRFGKYQEWGMDSSPWGGVVLMGLVGWIAWCNRVAIGRLFA